MYLPTIFTIHTQKAKSIKEYSMYPNEEEYLIQSGHALEVILEEETTLKKLCQYGNTCKKFKTYSENKKIRNVIVVERGL